ncbi:GNAT family N-acetyltransferase [Hahella ganghwensis]|uniref:GNAT family N-acetyltransferase n=1 Tax=Hahella ganghwensis TaxID=286420 RepID=UPI0003695C36|nr:GNAT family N-acetyltransferase [Hahella ganghwensis]
MESVFKLRLIAPSDNLRIGQIIRDVSAEFGLVGESGYGVCDPGVDRMFESYQSAGAAYWVVERAGLVYGGGGIAPLKGDPNTAELQKMYFLPECRGHQLGFQLASLTLEYATKHGFRQCYLETTKALSGAIALYKKMGFRQIDDPLGCTGHSACEIRMVKSLG